MKFKSPTGRFVVPGALALVLMANPAWAITTTFEATVTDISGSSWILEELGLPTDGTATLTARFTFDTDVSSGAISYSSASSQFDIARSAYESFSLSVPAGKLDAVASDGIVHRVQTRDGISDGTSNTNDLFQIVSYLNSVDPYYDIVLQSWDDDESLWDRNVPITASLLNSMTQHYFRFAKIPAEGGYGSIHSYSPIVYREISAVPLPAGLLLSLTGLALFLGFGKFGRFRHTAGVL